MLLVGGHRHKELGATVWGCIDLTVWSERQKIKPGFLPVGDSLREGPRSG